MTEFKVVTLKIVALLKAGVTEFKVSTLENVTPATAPAKAGGKLGESWGPWSLCGKLSHPSDKVQGAKSLMSFRHRPEVRTSPL